MSEPAFSSLTGYWAGAYVYTAAPGLGSVPFNATIEDLAGQLIGEIEEPNTLANVAAPRLFADIVGARTGQAVQFVKSMDGTGGVDHDILYRGVADADFMRIEGEWTIPGDWSGAFWMQRLDGAMALAREEAEQANP